MPRKIVRPKIIRPGNLVRLWKEGENGWELFVQSKDDEFLVFHEKVWKSLVKRGVIV